MLNRFAVLLVTAIAGLNTASQQAPAQPLNWAADDGKRVKELETNGRRIEGTNVVVWAPDAMSDAEQRALVGRLDRGVAALRERVGSHDWQLIGQQRITYYLSDDRFVAHGTGRAAVFIPLVRVQDGRAPYLHEAMHELLATADTRAVLESTRVDRTQTRPLWLSEGLPDFVAQSVSASLGITEGDVFDVGGLSGVDRTCAARLKEPAGALVLPFIGAPGRPDALFTTDRLTVAPTFYACAFSFTKFVVDRIGLASTIALFPKIATDDVHKVIEKSTGKPMADLRHEWQEKIGR